MRKSCLQSLIVNSDWSEEAEGDAPNSGHRAECQTRFPGLAPSVQTRNYDGSVVECNAHAGVFLHFLNGSAAAGERAGQRRNHEGNFSLLSEFEKRFN